MQNRPIDHDTMENDEMEHDTMEQDPAPRGPAEPGPTDTLYPAATFTVTRAELLGSDPLIGSAEIARGVCRGANRTIGVLSISPERMRRIDGWLGPIGFVTHAAGPDPTRPLLGSVCDRDRAGELVGSIIESLVGELPTAEQPTPFAVDAVGALAPAALPPELAWAVIVTAVDATGTPTHTIIGAATGLMMADVPRLDEHVELRPVGVGDVRARLVQLVGSPPRSVRDLLAED